MVAPEHRIANFNFVSSFMSTEHTNKRLADLAVDLPQGRPPSHLSVGGPRSSSPSPMDSSPPSEVDYAKRVLAQNEIDVKLDNIPDLTNQRLWADQANDRTVFPQSNMPLDQNEVIIPDPAPHTTGTNLITTPPNLEPSAIPY